MTEKYAARGISPDRADYAARVFVNGAERHGKSQNIEPIAGAWSHRFRDHPWAIEGDVGGWGKELRAACIHAVRQRLMAGLQLNDINIDDVMPEVELVNYWRRQAKRARSAAEWRKANPNHPALRGLVEFDVPGMLRKYGYTP